MLRSKYKVSLSMLLTVMMLLSMIPIQIAIASTTMPANCNCISSGKCNPFRYCQSCNGSTGYTGTGFVAGYDNSSTAKTTFTVTVGTSGDFYIDLRYCAGAVSGWPANRTVGLVVNGVSQGNIMLTGTRIGIPGRMMSGPLLLMRVVIPLLFGFDFR